MRYVDTWVCPECGFTENADDLFTPETDSAQLFCSECTIHNDRHVEMEAEFDE